MDTYPAHTAIQRVAATTLLLLAATPQPLAWSPQQLASVVTLLDGREMGVREHAAAALWLLARHEHNNAALGE